MVFSCFLQKYKNFTWPLVGQEIDQNRMVVPTICVSGNHNSELQTAIVDRVSELVCWTWLARLKIENWIQLPMWIPNFYFFVNVYSLSTSLDISRNWFELIEVSVDQACEFFSFMIAKWKYILTIFCFQICIIKSLVFAST